MSIFARFSLFCLVCLFSSCSSQSLKLAFHPTIEDKRFSKEQGKIHWKKATPYPIFGYSRSVQIIKAEGLTITKEGGEYAGGRGMATLISADGYALTADHVIGESKARGIIKATDKKRRLHMVSLPRKSSAQGESEQDGALLLFPNPERRMDKRSRKISVETMRIVYRFPGRDLALIKLAPSEAPFFQLGDRPSKGDWLFSSGNGISAAPFPSAGQVLKTGRNGHRFLAQMPSALGDSGGPVFDAKGHLVGIIVQITPEGRNKWRGIRWFQNSCCEAPDQAEVEKLIMEDRLRSSL